jgi:branched-chain amino acid transport system permease protein
MAPLLEHLPSGLASGAVASLAGLAFWLGLAATGGVELALVGCIGLAALGGAVAVSAGAPLLLALAAAVLGGALFAVLLEYFVAGRLRAAAFGSVGGVLVGLVLWAVLDRMNAGLGPLWRGVWPQAGLRVPAMQIMALLALASATAGLGWLLHRSWLGPALRAIGTDARDAELAGVDVRLSLLALAALAGALAALSGALAGLSGAGVWTNPALARQLGLLLLVKGLVAALAGERLALGRAGPALAAVIATGLALGLAETACAAWSAFALRDALAPLLLLALLLRQPRWVNA